jgi:hypothetical protein
MGFKMKRNMIYCLFECASLAGIILGIVSLHFGYALGSNENQMPVYLPFPNPGMVVSESFCLVNSGRFEIKLAIPRNDDKTYTSMQTLPPLKHPIHINITNERGFKIDRVIQSFRHEGRSYACHLEYYASPIIELPYSGDYFIDIRNRDEDYENINAMIIFARYEQVVEKGLLYALMKIFGYTIISIAIIGFVIIMLKHNHQAISPTSTL